MSFLFSLAVAVAPPGAPDALSAWDQFTEAIVNYKVVGAAGLTALFIVAVVSGLKRINAGGAEPNWWLKLPVLGRRMLIAGLGVLAGVFAAIQGGANPGQAIVVGLSGLLSIAGHELAQRVGVIGPFASDPNRNTGDVPASAPTSPPVPASPPPPPAPPAPPLG